MRRKVLRRFTLLPMQRQSWNKHILKDGALGQQTVVLEHEADPGVAETGLFRRTHSQQILSIQTHPSRRRWLQTSKHVKEGALATTRWPHDRGCIAGLKGQTDIGQDNERAPWCRVFLV